MKKPKYSKFPKLEYTSSDTRRLVSYHVQKNETAKCTIYYLFKDVVDSKGAIAQQNCLIYTTFNFERLHQYLTQSGLEPMINPSEPSIVMEYL